VPGAGGLLVALDAAIVEREKVIGGIDNLTDWITAQTQADTSDEEPELGTDAKAAAAARQAEKPPWNPHF
jgi:hypothetical protein